VCADVVEVDPKQMKLVGESVAAWMTMGTVAGPDRCAGRSS
jgi:hypothetical protein